MLDFNVDPVEWYVFSKGDMLLHFESLALKQLYEMMGYEIRVWCEDDYIPISEVTDPSYLQDYRFPFTA